MNWQQGPSKSDQSSRTRTTLWASTHHMVYVRVTPQQRRDLNRYMTAAYMPHKMMRAVKPGDVLWMVNVFQGELFLLGRLAVEFVVDDTGVAQELVDAPFEWQEAEWYAIANPYHVEPLRVVNLTRIAGRLRFQSDTVPYLTVVENTVTRSQELRPLQALTLESAALVEALWYDEAYAPSSVEDYLELTEDDQAYAEGRPVVRTVRERQRSRQLVQNAKDQFKRQHEGHLFCEVCGFNFSQTYGVDYIEAHHTEPLASLNEDEDTQQTVEALRMLCANCHRVAHTRTPPYTIEELKQMITSLAGKDG